MATRKAKPAAKPAAKSGTKTAIRSGTKLKLNASAAQVEDLVAGSRILARYGVLDSFGHVSARCDQRPDHFIISRSLAPALVTAGDLMELDVNSEPLAGDARKPFVERYIHGEIYRSRPDVVAVVHSHAASVIPFGLTGKQLRPVYHMGGFLGLGVANFEIRKHAGDTNLLVKDNYLGKALARTLGKKCGCVLMRGHGMCTVGGTIAEAVYRAIYAASNAAIQMQAMAMGGKVTYLTPGEAQLAMEANVAAIGRPWEHWKREVL